MWSSSSRDNWARLVAAVVKKQQIWELCHQHSRSPSTSTIATDDLSQQFLSFSGSNFEPFSVPPSPLLPLTDHSISQATSAVSKNASSRPITRMLFSAWYRIRKPMGQDLVDIPEDLAIDHLGLLRKFSIDELRVATRDFSGKIAHDEYRGWLADGSPVTVKRTKRKYISIHQLRREVEINSIVGHPNVIHILGFCITTNEHLLVYPLLVNGSVASCIWALSESGRNESKAPLNWPTRKGIALGAARGLAYLHEEICDKKVMHRDITPANILLNEKFEAVLADFGFAIVAEHDAPYVKVDFVCGTLGYMDPEYYHSFRCSEKIDVYSYGAFLLALISAQQSIFETQNLEEVHLRDLVKRKYMESKWEEIVDPNYTGNYMEDVVKLLMQIALLCTLFDPEKRPKMSEVVRIIEDGDDLTERLEVLLKDDDSYWIIYDGSRMIEDGDGLTERLKELLKDEELIEIDDSYKNDSNWIIYDDTFDLAAEELSGPR